MLDYLIKDTKIVDGTGRKPFSGDIAIEDGKIVDIGNINTTAKETIDAQGAYSAPGWIDIHTHLDGQVSWDDQLDPSASHGVTTVVLGNCGVGFAPVPKGGEEKLIELMEGVEDIPGTALHEGIEWGQWETFPEYMDYLAKKQYSMNIGTQIPHSAVRFYVMSERAIKHEDATDADLQAMCNIVREGIEAGALGFSTSRVSIHTSITGEPIPGTYASEKELLAIAETIGSTNKGVIQAIPSGAVGGASKKEKNALMDEIELLAEMARVSGRQLTFSLFQNLDKKATWKKIMARVAEHNLNGINLRPQVSPRPIGMVSGIQIYHMFQRREAYLKIAHLPLKERIQEMRKPEVKKAILESKDVPSNERGPVSLIHLYLAKVAGGMFPLERPINYEPELDNSFQSQATREGKTLDEYVYDYFTANNGENFAIFLGDNYDDHTFEDIQQLITDTNSVIGLSDAGAHVNMIFDAVAPTYQLTHWVRDRKRGDRLPLEFMIERQTLRNAQLYGLNDRGSLEIGKRADLNIFDLDNLNLCNLEVQRDLPAGGQRILQGSEGYLNTFVNGVKTRENNEDVGARPGHLLRSN